MLPMRRVVIIVTTLIAVGIIGWYQHQQPAEAIQVQTGDITQTIVATGRITPSAKIELASLITANIAQIYVHEGDHVTADEPLILLGDPTVDASVTQAQATLTEAQERLEELVQVTRPLANSSLAQAQATLTLAEHEYQRHQQLFDQHLLAKSTRDTSYKTWQVAKHAYDAAYQQYQATTNQGSSYRLLQTKYTQAQAALALAQAKQAQLHINAPTQGTILQKLTEVGATAQPGKPLLIMSQHQEVRIEAPIDEKSMRFLQIGQQAQVIADAYPQHPFTARLVLIYPSIDASRATINVRLLVDHPPSFLRDDMTVSIEMHTQHAKNALIVPTQAIHDPEQNPWVMTIDATGKTQQQPVTLGIQGIGETQLITGVQAGDWVITQPNVQLGSRVRAQPPISKQSDYLVK